MSVNVHVALAAYLAIGSGRPQTVLWMVVWVPVILVATGVVALVAAGLRWALWRFAPSRLQGATVAVVGLGALSGPLALFVFFASGDPRSFVEPARAGLDVVFAAPLVLGGSVASYLAERRVSVRRLWWWLMVLAGALLGLLLLGPASSLFPTYGAGVPSSPTSRA